MRGRPGKSLQNYYSISLTLIFAGLVYGLFTFWSKGPANLENISQVFEASLEFEDIKSKVNPGKVAELVANDRVRDAFKLIERLEKATKSLNGIQKTPGYDAFEDQIDQTKYSMNNLLSSPELSSIVSVLGNKMRSFEQIAAQNNWRTLTRLTRRTQALLSRERMKSPGFFSYEKVKGLNRNVLRSVKAMETVTAKSYLDRQKKSLIFNKLSSVKTELKMLATYLGHLKKFNSNFKGFQSSYIVWVKEIEPAISYKKIELERNSQTLLFMFLGLAGGILILGLFGYLVFRSTSKRLESEIEEKMLEVIKEGIVPVHNNFKGDHSKTFWNEFEKVRGYVHKRMSFGSVFQEATPFSSLLLDSNLNVVWANSLFYQQWSIDEQVSSDSSLTWDYLLQFTNLGEDDPVYSAVTENIAGIYQIQVRNEGKDLFPYEMYVSPVEYAGQKRIMILFYPLKSLEETLTHQTRSLVGPVAKSLEALRMGGFTSDFREKVKKDFDVAGIGHLFEKFKVLNEMMQRQKVGLLREIENLENQVEEFRMRVIGSKEIGFEVEKSNSDSIRRFIQTKDNFVKMIDFYTQGQDVYSEIVSQVKSTQKSESNLFKLTTSLSTSLHDNKKAFQSLIEQKKELKSIKAKMEEAKGRLTHTINQTLNSSSGKSEQQLEKLDGDLKTFEKMGIELSQVLMSFDIHLSKMTLILDQSEGSPNNLADIRKSIDGSRSQVEEDLFDVMKLNQSAELAQEETIQSLSELVGSFKSSRNQLELLNSRLGEGLNLQAINQNNDLNPETLKESPSA